jgi:hypothetical protein
MMRAKLKIAPLFALGWLVWHGHPALAEPTSGDKWRTEKCVRYTKAWNETLKRRGTAGLGEDFRQRHDAFLASGCLGAHNVCPRSPQEFDLANIMVIQAMNAGTASTFPPFGCP